MLEFTVNEQNFLAELMSIISYPTWAARRGNELSDIARQDLGDNIAFLAEKFPSVNVSELFDKFHRRGSNAN
jgi:hypothetical protein